MRREMHDDELTEMLARVCDEAYEHRDDPIPEDAKVTRGHARVRTLQVRLNCEEFDALARLADEREIPMSTMVRHVLLTTVLAGAE